MKWPAIYVVAFLVGFLLRSSYVATAQASGDTSQYERRQAEALEKIASALQDMKNCKR